MMDAGIKDFLREPSHTHQCMYLYEDGRRCRAQSMHNEYRCFRHRENYMPPVIENEPFEIAALEDRDSIQNALSQLAARLACNRIDLKRAGLLAYTSRQPPPTSRAPPPKSPRPPLTFPAFPNHPPPTPTPTSKSPPNSPFRERRVTPSEYSQAISSHLTMVRGQIRPMPSCPALRLALLSLSVSLSGPLLAQSCTQQMHQAGAAHSALSVSVAEFRIPSAARKHFEKARAASEANRPDDFARESAAALAIHPHYAELYVLQAAEQVRVRQYDAALATLAEAHTFQSDIPWASIVAASALNELHRYSEAADTLNRAVADGHDTWQFAFERARAETGRRDPESALHWSELAVTAAPVGCTDALLIRANALQIAGRSADSVHTLELFLKLDRRGGSHPQVLSALNSLRQSLDHQQSPDQTLLAGVR